MMSMIARNRCATIAMVGGVTVACTSSTSAETEQKRSKIQLVFLGTGSSIGCPRPVCASKSPTKDAAEWVSTCRTSWKALSGDPRHNPNYRNNPSLLVRVPSEKGVDGYSNIVIDAGKTFQEAIIRWFPVQSPPVASVDAVILTHEHADAMLGLDDVRGAQDPRPGAVMAPMPIYLSRKCLTRVSEAFPYLMPAIGKPAVERFVAKLDFRVVYENGADSSLQPCNCTEHDAQQNKAGSSATSPRMVPGMNRFNVGDSFEVTVLPVVHGEDCTCLGFAFGSTGRRVVYLSDLSRVPPQTMQALDVESEQGIDVLVLDCLKEAKHNTHLSLPEALQLIRTLRPKRALLVGISCDSFPAHQDMNRRLECWGTEVVRSDAKHSDMSKDEFDALAGALSASTKVEFARDGLVVDVEL